MLLKIGKFLILLFLTFPSRLFSQPEVTKYPARFSQYYNCFSLINPAASGSYNDFEISMGNKRHTGNFNHISTYYLNASMQVMKANKMANSPYSVVGLLLYNDREGIYLNRSRFYLTYVWHGHITRNLKMSGGFHIGGMNYSVKATKLTGGGSDFVPDGALGVRIYNKKFFAGASYNQIFNNEIQPLNEIAKLSSYINLTGGIYFKISEEVKLFPTYSVRITSNDEKYWKDFTLSVIYIEKFVLSLGVHNNYKLVNALEIKNILNDKKRSLDFTASYVYTIREVDLSTNFFELGLKYSFDKLR